MLVYLQLFIQYYIHYTTVECCVLCWTIVTSVSSGCRWEGHPPDMGSSCEFVK